MNTFPSTQLSSPLTWCTELSFRYVVIGFLASDKSVILISIYLHNWGQFCFFQVSHPTTYLIRIWVDMYSCPPRVCPFSVHKDPQRFCASFWGACGTPSMRGTTGDNMLASISHSASKIEIMEEWSSGWESEAPLDPHFYFLSNPRCPKPLLLYILLSILWSLCSLPYLPFWLYMGYMISTLAAENKILSKFTRCYWGVFCQWLTLGD